MNLSWYSRLINLTAFQVYWDLFSCILYVDCIFLIVINSLAACHIWCLKVTQENLVKFIKSSEPPCHTFLALHDCMGKLEDLLPVQHCQSRAARGQGNSRSEKRQGIWNFEKSREIWENP